MTILEKVAQRAFFDELAKLAWFTRLIPTEPAKFHNLEEAVQIRTEHEQPATKTPEAHIKTTKSLPTIRSVAKNIK